MLAEYHCQRLVYLEDMIEAEDRMRHCGPLAGAVRMQADIDAARLKR